MAQTESTQYSYAKRPLWQWVVLYVIIGAIVYGLIYYFVFAKRGSYTYQQNSQQYQYPTTAATTAPTATTTVSPAASVQITVTGSEFAFTPSTLTVKSGQTVQLTFKNMGTYPHNLTIPDLGVATKTITPGQEDTITFTPTKAGSFSFLCTVPGHADRGMKGTLIVE